MASPQGPDRKGDRVAKGVAAVLGVLIFTAATWVSQWVDSHPVSIVAATCAAVITLGTTVFLHTVLTVVKWTNDAVVRGVKALLRPRLGKVPVAVAVAVAVVVAGGGWLGARAAWLGPEPPPACAHPAELRVLTSIDGLEPYRALARRYERWTAGRNRDAPGCPTVHAFVYAAPSAAAATTAIAMGWRDTDRQRPLVGVGPRPDVWLPESTVDVRDVRRLASLAHVQVQVRTTTSIGSSQIVLATRRPVPDPVGAAPTWQQLLGAHRDARPALLAPAPRASSAGLLAAAGYLSDRTGALVPLGEARGRVRAVAGAAAGSNTALLCHWASASGSGAPDSVVTSDQAWRLFVTDDLAAGDCPNAPVRVGGTRVVPERTPVLDHPFVDFTWSTGGQRAVVDAFRGWLAGTDGRDALRAAGLDPPRPGCSGLDGNACVPSELDKALELYLAAQQAGEVLLVLDASGSMAEQVAGTGTTRFGVATRAVTQALGQMGPADKVGLWTFPASGRGGGQRRLVGIAAGGAAHRERIAGALAGVHPAGGTPLLDAVTEGMRAVGGSGSAAAGPRAVVVLTDGEDSTGRDPGRVRAEVARLARASGVRLFLIATGEASCAGLRELAAAGMGECFDADLDDQLVAAVGQLFDSLWKGQ